MRDFHKILVASEALLKYSRSAVEIYLNSCSLKTLKDIAEVVYVEFGLASEDLVVQPEDEFIKLAVPLNGVSSEETSDKSETDGLEGQESDSYDSRILNTALEVLQEHENGLTPRELEQELAKRGVIATATKIGHLLSKSACCIKQGTRWKLNERKEHNHLNNNWIPLSKRGYYKIDNEDVVIGFKKDDNSILGFKRIPIKSLKELYEFLPHTATKEDITKAAGAIGLKMAGFETYFMRIFAELFGGVVKEEGRQLVFIKEVSR